MAGDTKFYKMRCAFIQLYKAGGRRHRMEGDIHFTRLAEAHLIKFYKAGGKRHRTSRISQDFCKEGDRRHRMAVDINSHNAGEDQRYRFLQRQQQRTSQNFARQVHFIEFYKQGEGRHRTKSTPQNFTRVAEGDIEWWQIQILTRRAMAGDRDFYNTGDEALLRILQGKRTVQNFTRRARGDMQ